MVLSAIMYIPAAFAALVIPKYVQARLAARAGDERVAAAGRLSWNPLVHVDLLGAALLVLFRFGWPKPLKLAVDRLDGARKTAVLTALAGPVVNLILGTAAGLGLRALIAASGVPVNDGVGSFVYRFVLAAGADPALKYGFMLLFACAFANLVMAILNLVPLSPFDAGGILRAFLPPGVRVYADIVGRYTRYALVALVFLEVFLQIRVLYYVLYTPAHYVLAFITGTRGSELFEIFYVLTGI